MKAHTITACVIQNYLLRYLCVVISLKFEWNCRQPIHILSIKRRYILHVQFNVRLLSVCDSLFLFFLLISFKLQLSCELSQGCDVFVCGIFFCVWSPSTIRLWTVELDLVNGAFVYSFDGFNESVCCVVETNKFLTFMKSKPNIECSAQKW